MKILALIICMIFPSVLFSQSAIKSKKEKTDSVKNTGAIYTIVEDMPEPYGGYDALFNDIAKGIVYPNDAREQGVEGRVYITMTVDTAGNLTHIEVKRGLYPSLDDEALRIIKSLPPWKPGKQNGVPVKVQFNLPITFKL